MEGGGGVSNIHVIEHIKWLHIYFYFIWMRMIPMDFKTKMGYEIYFMLYLDGCFFRRPRYPTSGCIHELQHAWRARGESLDIQFYCGSRVPGRVQCIS